MERDFNHEEFEFFLKQKADQYKIYPSEKSWKNINGVLHSRWKWFTLGGTLLLLTSLFFLGNEFNSSNTPKFSIDKTNTLQQLNQEAQTGSSTKPQNTNSIQDRSATSWSKKATQKSLSLNTGKPSSRLAVSNDVDIVPLTNPAGREITNDATQEYDEVSIAAPGIDDNSTPGNSVADLKINTEPLYEEAAKQAEINWLEEMTAIKLSSPKKSPFNLQFYFSPSVSYRRLADNKTNLSTSQQNMPLATGNSNIDRYVDHKPSIGAEIGSNILFTAGRNLTFKTGLQLNYSRYTIKAYRFYFEKASIALNTMGPVQDTLTAYTSFRNFSGYSPEELQNQYLQISVPIGAELKLLGNRRLQLNVAGSVQPTYLLLNDTYLLSTDYVNYAKEPSLVRKWNVHTSMEAFVSYQLAGIRWQFGPQFRYQLMSSYNDRYPIKEYLMEYGFKLGVSKTLR